MSKWKCTVCKQVFEGERPPVPCPVCGAGEEAFVQLHEGVDGFGKDTNDKFVLIGGGAAAVEAAKAIRERNKTASVTIVSGEPHPPYRRPALNRVLEKGTPVQELLLEPPAFYEAGNIELRQGVRAEAIDTTQKLVRLSDGAELPYTKLLLATGSNPFNPIQPGSGSIPVHTLRSYDDTIQLAEQAKGKRIVIVGGGILGLEAAMALKALDCKVSIIERNDRFLPLQTDEYSSELLRSTLEKQGLDIITGDTLVSTSDKGVVLSGGVEMDADLVLASLGVRSETTLAVAIGLDMGRGIVVDDQMHTSHPDIWAAGDCAEFEGQVQARVMVAMAMGAVAGASMAGDQSARYAPVAAATIFRLGDFALFSVGPVGAETKEDLCYSNQKTGQYKRLFLEDGTLRAAVFVGDSPGTKAMEAVERGVGRNEALELLKGKA